jgi:hypothetical protein
MRRDIGHGPPLLAGADRDCQFRDLSGVSSDQCRCNEKLIAERGFLSHAVEVTSAQ